MGNRRHGWTNEDLERWVSVLLRAGVVVSASVVLLGGVVYLWGQGGEVLGHHVFRGEPAELRSLRGIVTGAWHLEGRAVIQLGLLLLIATPVARVAFSVAAFAAQRDRLYVVVLTVLLYGLAGAGW